VLQIALQMFAGFAAHPFIGKIGEENEVHKEIMFLFKYHLLPPQASSRLLKVFEVTMADDRLQPQVTVNE
jgi:hypothetical protein